MRAQSNGRFEELCSPLVVHAFVEYSLDRRKLGSKRTIQREHALHRGAAGDPRDGLGSSSDGYHGRFLECRGGLGRRRRHCRFRQLLLVQLLLLLPVGLRLGRRRRYVGLGGRRGRRRCLPLLVVVTGLGRLGRRCWRTGHCCHTVEITISSFSRCLETKMWRGITA